MSRRPVIVERGSARHRAMIGAGAVLAVAAALWASGLAPYEQGQVTRVMVFAVAIAGLNLATGYLGLLSVGHSAFFGLGAFTTGILIVHYGWEPWLTIPVAFVVCLIAGLIVGLPALRIRGLYLAMVTLAFAVAFPELVAHFSDWTGGSGGMRIRRADLGPPEWTGLGLADTGLWNYWIAVIVLFLTLYVTARLVTSRYGLAMAAVRQNEIAASASGIDIALVKTGLFGLSGAVTGVAGSVFAMYMGSLYAEGSFTLLAGITLLIGLIIGGERTILGPVLGALVIIYVPDFTAGLGLGQAAAVVFALVLLLVVFVAPSGAAGGIAALIRRVVVVVPVRPDSPPAGDPAVSSPQNPSAPQKGTDR